MEKSLFFDARTVNGQPDRTYSAADLAALRSAYYENGVLSANALAVTANGNMSVTVAPGAAVIAGYTYILDEPKTLNISANSTAYTRNDVVVARLDLSERTMTVDVLAGTPSSQPVTPVPSTSGSEIEIALAKIELPPQTSAASQCVITDKRPFAATRVMEAPFQAMIASALAEMPSLSEDELTAVRSLLARITTSGFGEKALCDDGRYHSVSTVERVELVRYDTPGEYEFDPAEYQSANGLYDVEVIGGGGAGGSVIGLHCRGGGGGAGVCVTTAALRLPDVVSVSVGAGGEGESGRRGGDGAPSSFGQIIAEGGEGGSGGNYVTGGYGGETSPFSGAAGADGTMDTSSVMYLDKCGAGASTVFGAGAPGYNNTDVSLGIAANASGAGGSGAGGPSALSGILAGGDGASGAVVVYGYVVPSEGE